MSNCTDESKKFIVLLQDDRGTCTTTLKLRIQLGHFDTTTTTITTGSTSTTATTTTTTTTTTTCDSSESQGKRIASAILRHVNQQNSTTDYDTPNDQVAAAAAVAVQVYDNKSNSFVSLDDDQQGDNDVVSKLGTIRRLRCILISPRSRRRNNDTNNPVQLLPIAGRYYPYDNGMSLSVMMETTTTMMKKTTHRLVAWEMPNIPGAGTGLNVWDGAILLYVIVLRPCCPLLRTIVVN